jgi:hypothetical protein
MKKRHTNKIHKTLSTSRRDYTIANRRLPRLIPILIKQSGEDFRRFHPERSLRPLRSLSGRPIRPRPTVTYKKIKTYSPKLMMGSYKIPQDAVICAKRNVRKSVLFAKNKAGRAGQKTPRFNENSQLQCR